MLRPRPAVTRSGLPGVHAPQSKPSRAAIRPRFARVFGGYFDSASSSGVILVAMVLARRIERDSPCGETGDCNGPGMRGMLMGKPASKSACTPANRSSSVGMMEAFSLSVRLRGGRSGVLCAFTRVNALA